MGTASPEAVTHIPQEQKATLKLPLNSPIRANSPILISNQLNSSFPTNHLYICITPGAGQVPPEGDKPPLCAHPGPPALPNQQPCLLMDFPTLPSY